MLPLHVWHLDTVARGTASESSTFSLLTITGVKTTRTD